MIKSEWKSCAKLLKVNNLGWTSIPSTILLISVDFINDKTRMDIIDKILFYILT